MKKHELRVWFVASRPYPEKALGNKFYSMRELAEEACRKCNSIGPYYNIYQGTVIVEEN